MRNYSRKPLPADLPRKRFEYALPPEQLACPGCGQERTQFGEEVSEQLEFVPASLFVIQHARLKYACRHCQAHVVVADKPTQPIEKGIPGPGLLAATITSKYCDHLPLYRREDVFGRHGVELSRVTMCGWMRQSAVLLAPLYDLMQRRVLASRVIHTDDTPVPVLDASLPHTRTGRFWAYLGDVRNPYVLYDYTLVQPDRGIMPQYRLPLPSRIGSLPLYFRILTHRPSAHRTIHGHDNVLSREQYNAERSDSDPGNR